MNAKPGRWRWAIVAIRKSGEGTVHAGHLSWCLRQMKRVRRDNPGSQVNLVRIPDRRR